MREKAKEMAEIGIPVGLVSMPEKFCVGIKNWNKAECRPSIDEWPHYENEGVCLFTGQIEVIDVDSKNWAEGGDFTPKFIDALRHSFSTFDDLIYYRTQSGGLHVPFKNSNIEQAEGNQKLAIRRGCKQALIETRGLNGLAVCPPTQGYEWLSNGHWDDIPTMKKRKREELLSICRDYNQAVDVTDSKNLDEITKATEQRELDPARPGDDWTIKTDFLEYLSTMGWKISHQAKDGEVLLTRPDKKTGVSASWNLHGLGRLWVFSSSAGLPTSRMLSPFAVKTYLEHGGNFEASNKQLRDFGYGQDLTPVCDVSALSMFEHCDITKTMSKHSPSGELADSMKGIECQKMSLQEMLDDEDFIPSIVEEDHNDKALGDVLNELEYNVKGPLGQIYSDILNSATYPNKIIAFAGALVGFSGVLERRWCTPMDGRANLELVCLADSGTGKDHPRKYISQLYVMLGLTDRLCGVAASKEGLEDFFSASNPPVGINLADEADGMLQALKNQNDRNARGLWDFRLEVYSSANSVIKTRMKAGGGASRPIIWPFLSVLSSAIPSMFFGALTDIAVMKGLVPRCIVLDAGGRGKINRHSKGIRIKPELIDSMKAYIDYQNPTEKTGNLGNTSAGLPAINRLEWGDGADDYFYDVIVDFSDDRGTRLIKQGAKSGVLWSRAAENTCKLAMMYSLSVEGPTCREISYASLQWAWEIIRASVESIEARIDAVGCTKDSELLAKFVEAIKKAPEQTMSRTALIKAIKLRKKDFDEYLVTLKDAGIVHQSLRKSLSKMGPKEVIFYSV